MMTFKRLKEDQIMKHQHGWRTMAFLTMTCLFNIHNAFAGDDGDVLSALKNATYAGIGDRPVTLSEGRWEGAPYVEGGAARPTVGLADDFLLEGDLDGDGKKELVVMLWQSSAGTGSNVYIAAMKPENGGYVNVSTALLGDRVKLRDGRIDAGRIVLDVLQPGKSDPMCCPTELAERSWRLSGGQLEEQAAQVTGTLSVAALEGGHWQLTSIDRGQPMPANVEITLSFDAGRIAGSSGCNRYSAAMTDGERPGDVVIGPAMATRRACPEPLMEAEMHFLDTLSLVQSFSFQVGKLALNGQADDGTPFSMLFAVAAGDAP